MFVGGTLIPLVSVAAVSGTTYDTSFATSTVPETTAEHTVAIQTVSRDETNLLNMASGSTWSLLGFTHILNAPNGGVWRKNPLTRGSDIESTLARTDYKDWFNVGQLDNGKFPLVDFQRGNNLVSLKSVDTGGSTWIKRMQDHITDLGARRGTVNGNPANMILDLRVQPGGRAAAESLIDFGNQNGISVIIKEIP